MSIFINTSIKKLGLFIFDLDRPQYATDSGTAAGRLDGVLHMINSKSEQSNVLALR